MTTDLICVENPEKEIKIDSFHMPRWTELPSIDLYIDQIISLIDKCLGPLLCHHDGFPLTKSMINNYVKAKIVDAPVNKKYPRLSVAMIIVVCILKNNADVFSKLIQIFLCNLLSPVKYFSFFCF